MDENNIFETDDQENAIVQEQQGNNLNKPSPKKSKKGVISIVAGAVAFLCIAGVVAAKVVVPVALPKVFVADALKTTQKTLLQEKKVRDDITGTQLALQILGSEAVQTDFDLQFKGLSGEGAEYINAIIRGIGISGQSKRDQEGQKLLMNFAVNQNMLRLAGAEFYKNDAEVGFAIPELFDKYMVFNLDTFVEDYNHSALFDLIGEPIDQEAYDEIRDYYESYSNQSINEEFASGITKKVNKLNEELFMQADVKYIGKTNSEMGTRNSDYNTYEIILKEDDLKSYIKSVFDTVVEDQAFIDYIEAIDSMQKAIDGESMGVAIKEAKFEIDNAIDKMTFDDLKIRLMINNKKHIVESSYETIVRLEGESVEIKVASALTGTKFMTDAIEFVLNIKNEDQQVDVVVESTSNYGENTNELVHNIAIDVKENKTMLTRISLDMNYDTKLKEDNLAINANVKAEGKDVFSVILEGAMNNDKANKKIEYDMSNIAIKLNDGYINYGIAFSGKYSLSAIKTSDIKFKENNKQYVFKMTQEELMTFSETVSLKVEQLGSVLFR